MEFLHREAVAGPRLEPAQGGLLSEDRLDRSVVLQPAPSYVTPNEGRTPNADNVDNEDPDMPPLESSDEVGLPEVPVDGASANAKYMDERNLCIICQDTIILDEQETVKLSCMHTFHLTCGTNWLQKDPRCPTCRDPVSSNNRGIITRPGNPLPMHICFSRGAYLSTSIHHRPPIRIAAAEGVNLSVTTENATGMRGNVGGRINSRPGTDHQRRYTENRTESYMETRNSTRVPPCAPISQRRPRRNRPHRRSRNRQAPPTQPLNGMDAYLNGIEEGRRLTNQETGSSRMAEAAIKMFILFLMYMLVANRGQVNAASLNAIDPSASRSQAEITKYRAADILLYESHPRQIAPCLTSESVDVSILDTIQSELDDLLEYAKNLGKDTRVSVGQAEHYCPPAYPRQLTDALDSTILMPHYAEILENPVRPNKVFIVSLYKDKNIRSCNYSLTQHTTYHLQASHGSGTDAYYYSREAMYNNYKRWLVNNKGEKCIDKLDVYRGEIIEKETIRRMIVPHVESGLYGCAESCRSINNLIQGRRNRDNCLTKDCGKIDDRMCRAFSYNWRTELCRHSDRHNPERDNSYHYGFNALTTSERCLSAIQHTEALIMVNNTMANLYEICRYDLKQTISSSPIYRKCPGQSKALESEVIPLVTLLDGFLLDIKPKFSELHNTSTVQVSIKNLNQGPTRSSDKNKRSLPTIAAIALNTIKPSLAKFVSTGVSRLTNALGIVHHGAPLGMASLLFLPNLIAAIIHVAVEQASYTCFDDHVVLTHEQNTNYSEWDLIRGPDLYKLESLSPICNNKEIIKSNSIPTSLRNLHRLLNQLQAPLARVIKDPQPLSQTVRNLILKEETPYGFWSGYDPNTKVITRFYTYPQERGWETSRRQIAAISGSMSGGIIQGTTLIGSDNNLGPDVTCVSYCLSANESTQWLPDSCFMVPNLREPKIFSTPFLPAADIYRIRGNARIHFNCPSTGPGSLTGLGLLVVLVPRPCHISLDGTVLRPHDPTARSAWNRVLELTNTKEDFKSVRRAPFPTSLKQEIMKIANLTNGPLV